MAAGAQLGDVDLPDQQTPTMPPIQGAPAPLAASPSQPQAPGLGQPAQGGIAQGTGNAKGEIPTPDVQLKFKPDKLAKAQTTLDLLNAATASSRKDYMDWWEKQHGDINDRYDHLRSQLGARPSDDEPQSKKEKFAALLEFGLHLMKNSAQPTTNQGGVLLSTLSDEHDAAAKQHQASIEGAQSAYDTQAQAIESARQKEQQGIGTPAQAQKAADERAKDVGAATKDQAAALKGINDVETTKASSLGAPTYAVGPGGVIHSLYRDEEGKAHAEPVTGIDGKPFQGRVLGREAGSGIDKSNQDPAAVRTHRYLVNVLGMDSDTAARLIFKPKTGNIDADHAAIYKSALAATLGDDDKAKRIADQYVLDQYGAGGLARAHAPLVPQKGVPPPEALRGLERGKVRHFGAQGDWTLGINGQPVRVGGGPQSIQ